MKAALAVKCVISESTWLLQNTLFHVWSKLWLLNCILKISSLMDIVLLNNILVNVMKAAKLVKDYCTNVCVVN